MSEYLELAYAMEMLADVIIEKEGACGMSFGRLEFEARWKCNNNIAYCRNRTTGTHKGGLPQLTLGGNCRSFIGYARVFPDGFGCQRGAG